MKPVFPQVTSWRIPDTVLPDSLQEMAIDGRAGNEGLVLWLGHDQGKIAEVAYLVKLRGPNISKRPNQIRINSALFNDLADVAIENGVRLIGQIHTHGPGYPLDLSLTDRAYGLQTPFYLSVVAPNYGLSATTFMDCGVHVYVPRKGFVRLRANEVGRRIRLLSGPHLPFVELGGER